MVKYIITYMVCIINYMMKTKCSLLIYNNVIEYDIHTSMRRVKSNLYFM